MDALDQKTLKYFSGKIVRKDLTNTMKKGLNVPSYVLEYLLGMYCSTEDENVINSGMEKIRKVLSQNYVRPGQSEYIKSKIRENGSYTIIDKISVIFDEKEDKYVARFTNLRIAPFEVSSDFVVHNEKLLLGGIWCIITISYHKQEDGEQETASIIDIFGNIKQQKQKKIAKSRYNSPFEIVNLKPIQMPNINLQDIISRRQFFNKDEWMALILRSVGFEYSELTQKERMHYLLRLVPLIQKNYNLVELGIRGTGKSHVYSEFSPYSILISGGYTSVSNLFYNVGRRRIGLVGHWDCIAFDEVAGMDEVSDDAIQIMKNYMANASFARGPNSMTADASFAFEGNTTKSPTDMLRLTTLFDPFPKTFNTDAAFFDRIHAYLPGWETPKVREKLFTNHFGLISDCFAEFCHGMRAFDFTNLFDQYFKLNKNFNTRDEIAVKRTFSGFVKLLYPDTKIKKEEAREILEYAIECRRRVKEQLKKMAVSEFDDVNLGYIDLATNKEIIVEVPEQPKTTLVSNDFLQPGHAYAIGNSLNNNVGVYRLENRLIPGTGKFEYKTIEGAGINKTSIKKALTAAFTYFISNISSSLQTRAHEFDYALYFNDLQEKGASNEITVAEVVALFSAFYNQPILPSTIIVGRVVMSGSMMPLTKSLADIIMVSKNAGAKNIVLPRECEEQYSKLPPPLVEGIKPIFYDTPMDAVRKSLGFGD